MTTLAFAPPVPTLAHVRPDTLPENTRYRDDGCDVSATCLTCPLQMCKYDDPGWLQRENRKDRDAEVMRLRQSGVPVAAIASQFGVSTRTVHRVLQRGGLPQTAPAEDEEGPLLTLQELAARSLFRPRTPPLPLFARPGGQSAPGVRNVPQRKSADRYLVELAPVR